MRLPDPLPLPAEPDTLMHVQAPHRIAAAAHNLLPNAIDPNAWLAMELGFFVERSRADAIARAVDAAGPWDGVEFGEAAIFHLPITPAAYASLSSSLAELPPEGEFGAVRLPGPPGGQAQILAWLRETSDGPRITLARSLPGLVSGIELASTYGRAPIVGTATVERLRPPSEAGELPLERVWVEGEVDDLKLRMQFEAGFDPLAEAELGAGAMTPLLRERSTLIGASSRYMGYSRAVSRVISQIQSQIDDLPFLVKGFATDLAARFNAILRGWDGRVLVAFADGHMRWGYGAEDPKKAGVAVLHFVRGVTDGISLVRNFSSDVPDVRLKKNAASAGGIEVHRIDLRGVKGMARELEPMLDDHGALHVAFAADARFAGVIGTVGPRADAELARWIEGLEGSVPPISDAPEGALHVALSRAQLETLAQAAMGGALDFASLWTWKAEGPPFDIELRRESANVMTARIQGPPAPREMQVVLPAQK